MEERPQPNYSKISRVKGQDLKLLITSSLFFLLLSTIPQDEAIKTWKFQKSNSRFPIKSNNAQFCWFGFMFSDYKVFAHLRITLWLKRVLKFSRAARVNVRIWKISMYICIILKSWPSWHFTEITVADHVSRPSKRRLYWAWKQTV